MADRRLGNRRCCTSSAYGATVRFGIFFELPSFAVSASSARADVTLKPVRFACRPDVWAFEGTEPI